MKVVRPEWLVESAKGGVLLPWRDFIFVQNEKLETIEGTKLNTKSNQTTLFPAAGSAGVSPANNSFKPLQSQNISVLNGDPAKPSSSSGGVLSLSKNTSDKAPNAADPLYTTDPKTFSEAARVPGYAAHTSNPNARRAMADSGWRNAHTSVAPDFIEGYYKNSRLHHLAMWKAELKNLVQEAQERAESATTRDVSSDIGAFGGDEHGVSMRGMEFVMRSPGKGKGKAKAADEYPKERVIMHCDFDCFFVSAGLVSRPHLKGKPVVVCHSQGNQGGGSSTSEIASSSYEARKFGIRNGMRSVVSIAPHIYHNSFPPQQLATST